MSEETKQEVLAQPRIFRELIDKPPIVLQQQDRLLLFLTGQAEQVQILEENFLLSYQQYTLAKQEFDSDCEDSNYTEEHGLVLHGKVLSRQTGDLIQKCIQMIEKGFGAITKTVQEVSFGDLKNARVAPAEIVNRDAAPEDVMDSPFDDVEKGFEQLKEEIKEEKIELPDEFKEDIKENE